MVVGEPIPFEVSKHFIIGLNQLWALRGCKSRGGRGGLTKLMNHNAVCREALATQGLLMIVGVLEMFSYSYKK